MSQLDQLIESYRDEMIKDAQSLVRIKSVRTPAVGDFPFGEGVQKSLEKALEIAQKLGFRTENIDNYAGEAEFGQGEECIGLLGHLDVVPEGNGWTYPPYGAELHDGFIYGRGIADNKGPTIVGLYAMKAVMESKLPLRKRVRMIFGTNEESGMLGVKYYVDKKGAPTMSFVPDAMFPVIHGEKGIMSFKLKADCSPELKPGTSLLSGTGGNAVNSVPDICKVVLKTTEQEALANILLNFSKKEDFDITWQQNDDLFEITTHGLSAHGSMPQLGKNAITYMFSILGHFAPAEASPMAEFIHLYNQKIAFEHFGAGIGCGLEDKESGKLAFNPGLFALTEHGIEISVNIRYPVTHTVEEVYAGIEKEIAGSCAYLERLSNSNPLYFPVEHPLVATLMRVYKDKTDNNDAQPLTMGGGTYARKLPNAVAFGPGFPWSQSNAHKPDEKGSIEDMLLAAKIYAQAIYELAK